ncbi:MAG: hypothetical protein JSV03_12385, partial [Planctomycetota bacterium]
MARLFIAIPLTFVCYTNLRAAEPIVIQRWEFNSPQDMDGWSNCHDLKDMKVIDGTLRMTITGPDAYIFAPPVEVLLDSCMVRICMRCDKDGSIQVYWKT